MVAEGWQQGFTEEGTAFFFNKSKGLTQWDEPEGWDWEIQGSSAGSNGIDWQPYVDHAVSAWFVSAGGFYDLQGNKWATSPGFPARAAEVEMVSAVEVVSCV